MKDFLKTFFASLLAIGVVLGIYAFPWPDVLRSVCCLRMPPPFEGVLTLDWRV